MTCPLCVMWRCARCKSQDWPECCGWSTASEPFWPDGTLAVVDQVDYCGMCEASMDEMDRSL